MGNIGAVPVLLVLGGPGAVFWMIMAGLLGMSSKFAECTLGVKYRNEYPDGTVSGGPMYSLKKGLTELGKPGLGKFLGAFFAITMIFGCLGAGNMFQANQAYVQFVNITGGEEGSFLADKGWLFGLVFAVVVAVVIIGGIKSIAKVTEKVVPFMAIFYVTGALIVLAMNAERIPAAVASIFTNAFSPEGVTGGFIGVLILGFQRAAFSNEAGIGSAAIAHSAVRTKEPVTEGLVSLLEPFIDTVVICTITALVILTTVYGDPSVEDISGVALTSEAMERNIAWFPTPLAIAVILFAFSTMLSWSYYGLKGWTYIVGESKARGRELQADLLPVHRHRLHHPADLGARLLRRDALRHGDPEHPRHLLPRPDHQAGDELLLRSGEERGNQELPEEPGDRRRARDRELRAGAQAPSAAVCRPHSRKGSPLVGSNTSGPRRQVVLAGVAAHRLLAPAEQRRDLEHARAEGGERARAGAVRALVATDGGEPDVRAERLERAAEGGELDLLDEGRVIGILERGRHAHDVVGGAEDVQVQPEPFGQRLDVTAGVPRVVAALHAQHRYVGQAGGDQVQQHRRVGAELAADDRARAGLEREFERQPCLTESDAVLELLGARGGSVHGCARDGMRRAVFPGSTRRAKTVSACAYAAGETSAPAPSSSPAASSDNQARKASTLAALGESSRLIA